MRVPASSARAPSVRIPVSVQYPILSISRFFSPRRLKRKPTGSATSCDVENACRVLEFNTYDIDFYQVKLQYRKLAKKYHPDLNRDRDTTEIDIAKIPTFSETLAPWISLANISLPNSSVPNQCFPLGGISLSVKFSFISSICRFNCKL